MKLNFANLIALKFQSLLQKLTDSAFTHVTV